MNSPEAPWPDVPLHDEVILAGGRLLLTQAAHKKAGVDIDRSLVRDPTEPPDNIPPVTVVLATHHERELSNAEASVGITVEVDAPSLYLNTKLCKSKPEDDPVAYVFNPGDVCTNAVRNAVLSYGAQALTDHLASEANRKFRKQEQGDAQSALDILASLFGASWINHNATFTYVGIGAMTLLGLAEGRKWYQFSKEYDSFSNAAAERAKLVASQIRFMWTSYPLAWM